jgi:methionine-gamma-lyase
MATASGMGAIATVLLSLASSGDHLVAQRDLYGGTYSLLAHTAPRFGVEVSFVDAGDPAAIRAALRPTIRAIYAETIANPTMAAADLPAWPRRQPPASCHVDNTVAPHLCHRAHGASVVHRPPVPAGTAMSSGHRAVRRPRAPTPPGGSAIGWRPPDLPAARLVLRGPRPVPACGPLAPTPIGWPSCRTPTPSPASTGPVCRSPDAVGLPKDFAARLLSFDLSAAGGRPAVHRGDPAALAASLGSVETLVSHPASTTHRQLSSDALAAAGIGEGMVRVSVGLEDGADLAEDFTRALEVA